MGSGGGDDWCNNTRAAFNDGCVATIAVILVVSVVVAAFHSLVGDGSNGRSFARMVATALDVGIIVSRRTAATAQTGKRGCRHEE